MHQGKPGISATRIAEVTGISRGTVTYHLSRLRSKEKIKRVHTGGYVGFFLAGTDSTPHEEHALLHLQNATEKEILFLLLDMPGLSQSEIAAAIGISGPAVSWHMMRLDPDGIIQSSVAGRKTYYRLMPGIPAILTHWTGCDGNTGSTRACPHEFPENAQGPIFIRENGQYPIRPPGIREGSGVHADEKARPPVGYLFWYQDRFIQSKVTRYVYRSQDN
jgi:DNA-binding CsgD family transcriptional regulator